jgi:hypothetical protein
MGRKSRVRRVENKEIKMQNEQPTEVIVAEQQVEAIEPTEVIVAEQQVETIEPTEVIVAEQPNEQVVINEIHLPDEKGGRKNFDGSVKDKCIRCGRGIVKNQVYYTHEAGKVGADCHAAVLEIEKTTTDPEEVRSKAKKGYAAKMRELTLAGMIKAGIIKPKTDKVEVVEQPAPSTELALIN